MGFESNEVLEKLPKHLMGLVIEQPYNGYTAQDHAVWRYVMRQNVHFLGKVAHRSYLDGLKQTGISVDRIPHMYGMNRILKEIGWAAVAVDGFIPPQAFMEFQAYNVLVIAADIRNVEHVEYTPAPDILHEAAGHAPIIADPEYAAYLRRFGEIGAKAFSSAQDYKLYEAIRHLSIIKEDPSTSKEEISEAEKQIETISANMGKQSEMSLIRNLHWWTVEYGLIGDLDKFHIYGAGLLSSIGESVQCMQPKVLKYPYTIDAVNFSFDITTMQPQLFVTPDFKHLTDVLEEFADRMAFRKGGVYGLQLAWESQNVGTVVLENGLQFSGVLDSFELYRGEPSFVKFSSPTQVCRNDKELDGHGKSYHAHGYSTPVGPVERINGQATDAIEEQYLEVGAPIDIRYRSGFEVRGRVKNLVKQDGVLLLIALEDCTVKKGEKHYFQPEWGIFDLAVGHRVVSCYSGPADPDAYGWSFEAPDEKTHKLTYSEEEKRFHELFERVREIRERNEDNDELLSVYYEVRKNRPDQWLLLIEILEIVVSRGILPELEQSVRNDLLLLQKVKPQVSKLIEDGLNLVDNRFNLIHT